MKKYLTLKFARSLYKLYLRASTAGCIKKEKGITLAQQDTRNKQ